VCACVRAWPERRKPDMVMMLGVGGPQMSTCCGTRRIQVERFTRSLASALQISFSATSSDSSVRVT
jgi:hypothetical protein